jgi:RNA polymerase sigma-70 factor (ECF subfamily)
MPDDAEARPLAERLLPHLDAAYNLARWLVCNSEDAEDVVQQAFVRALRYAHSFRGGDARAWVLAIVRNASYEWLGQARALRGAEPFDEEAHSGAVDAATPELLLLRQANTERVEAALARLSPRDREILVLREMEGFSYSEIAELVGVPIGTVMSRLSRARQRFRQEWDGSQPWSARTKADSSASFTSETAQNDIPSRVQ